MQLQILNFETMNYQTSTGKRRLLIIFSIVFSCLAFCRNNIFAQSVTPSILSTTGDYYANAAGSLSWTLGEPVIETYSDATNILTQGFQQTAYSITAVNNIPQPGLNISVFPNPFISAFTISSDGSKQLYAEIVDESGRMLFKKTLSIGNTQMNVSSLSDAIYILKVYDNSGLPVRTFKIEKTK